MTPAPSAMIRRYPFNDVYSTTRGKPVRFFFQYLYKLNVNLMDLRYTVLMYIHRSFFAKAIIEYPVNPLRSPYAASFLAAYRASSTILKSTKEQFEIWPNSCSRFFPMWTFSFSAAVSVQLFILCFPLSSHVVKQVVFGTVVARGPRSPLAQAAMAELEQAYILFGKASAYGSRAVRALVSPTALLSGFNS